MAAVHVEPKPHNSWAETRPRHYSDTLLRAAGFTVHARPAGQVPATWTRGGVVYSEQQAHELRRAEIEAQGRGA